MNHRIVQGVPSGKLGVIADESVRLTDLEPMRCAVVTEVAAEGSASDQLKSMGVCNGRKVEVVKHGDPLILKVLATRIGISARLAEKVYVAGCSSDECVSGT